MKETYIRKLNLSSSHAGGSAVRPAICVPTISSDSSSLAKEAAAIAAAPADLCEWRIDLYLRDRRLTGGELASELEAAAHAIRIELGDKPLLATVRTSFEGGLWSGSASEYSELMRTLIKNSDIDAVDIELGMLGVLGMLGNTETGAAEEGALCNCIDGAESCGDPADETESCVNPVEDAESCGYLVDEAHSYAKAVIMSYHNFDDTPAEDELIRILSLMQQLGCDVAKAAVMPNDMHDVLSLLSACEEVSARDLTPVIAISMGEMGKVSRTAGGFFGSCLTFGALGGESAPGQIDVSTLREAINAMYGDV